MTQIRTVLCPVDLTDVSAREVDLAVEVAGELAPDLIVMGEHARELLRRFLTRDTARRVLHRAPCPVWFVPPTRMAA